MPSSPQSQSLPSITRVRRDLLRISCQRWQSRVVREEGRTVEERSSLDAQLANTRGEPD